MAHPTFFSQSYGIWVQPHRHPNGLDFARVTFVRAIGNVPPGPVARPVAATLYSTIGLRQRGMAKARTLRLQAASAVLPIFTDTVDAGGTLNVLPIFLGTHNAMLRRPRLRMAKAYMNVKFGTKTRPC